MIEDVRLQKYLSDCGICSRRKAEEKILAGEIAVNGRPAVIGQKIHPAKDRVTYLGKVVEPKDKLLYFKLNKPRGYVSTLSDEKGRKCITDLIRDIPARVYPIGRLDLNSEGLLLLTNDGALANALMHPSSEVEKVYLVKVRTAPSDEQLRLLNGPMTLDGYTIRPCRVTVPDPTVPTKLRFILKEGRNRQIRKMCEQVGLEVSRLKRVAEGKITLDGLPNGKWRALDEKEIAYLKKIGVS